MSVFFYALIKLRNKRFIGKISIAILKVLGLEIPSGVKLGNNVQFKHLATGSIIHPSTIIEDNVQIFQGVTLGRADAYTDYNNSKMKGIHIKEGAVICAGAKVLCKRGTLIVGKNTIVGANSVLLNSTGDNEIWAGIPAEFKGIRKDNHNLLGE